MGSAMNRFDFLYCCLYRWSERVNGKRYPNAYSASIMMSFILMLVGGTLFSVIVVLSDVDVLSVPAGKVIAGLFPIAIFAVVHWHFSYRDRSSGKLRDFDRSTSKFRTRPGVAVGAALGSALALLFAVWALLAQLNQ